MQNIDCNLPDNFQTWFSITQLHVWMLMVRLRAEDHGKMYIQELVNRFFEDAEERIRLHGVRVRCKTLLTKTIANKMTMFYRSLLGV